MNNIGVWISFSIEFSLQNSGQCFIIAHGGETYIEQGRGTRGGASMVKPRNRSIGVSQWLPMEGKRVSCREGGGCGAWGGTSITITA